MPVLTSPEYPVAGEQVTLSLSIANGENQVYEVTSRPSASALPLTFLTLPFAPTGTAQAIVEADKATNLVTFDVPGDYTITAYDFREVIGLASFGDDPSAGRRFQLRAKQSTVIHVGASMRLPLLTTMGHGAVLQIAINDIVVDFANRGVVRSASLVEPTTDIATGAILDSAVVAALAGLIGVTAGNLGTSLIGGVNELRTKYEAHRILTAGGVHNVADSINAVRTYPVNSQEYAIQALNETYTRVLGHLQATVNGTRWHDNDDGKNVPVSPKATNAAQATQLLSDLRYRVYERHRVQTISPSVHGAADNTNTLTAATPLDILVAAFLDAIVSLDSSAATGGSEGANDASHQYGFEHV